MNKLPSIFEMDPKKVPINEFPISHTQPIFDFNQVCYNTAVEFVDGFNQDDVRESKYGQYCKQRVNELAHQIGKNKKFVKNVVTVPIITPRPKFFSEGMKKFGNPEKAKNYCLQQSNKHDTNPYYCESAYMMYNELNTRENFETDKKDTKQKNNSSDTEDDKPNCTVVSIVSVLLSVLFIIAIVLTINMLTTGVLKKK
jgi:hypothetical protein